MDTNDKFTKKKNSLIKLKKHKHKNKKNTKVRGLMALMASGETGPINIGNPDEYSIKELAENVTELVNQKVKRTKQIEVSYLLFTFDFFFVFFVTYPILCLCACVLGNIQKIAKR